MDQGRSSADTAAAVTPNAHGWLALAEAEHSRVHDTNDPGPWHVAASSWDRLDRPPLAAYCRWREAETLVTAGASRAEAQEPLRQAYRVATTIGATPLAKELDLLAQRGRLEVSPTEERPPPAECLEQALGLTSREAEVLALVACGLTNREIAEHLVISEKTASVHVSHILRKLDVSNRQQAAAIAHKLD
jgi:DNA-binding CsgD family transcriptional regulator